MEFFSLPLFFGKLKYILKVPVFCFPHNNSTSWVRRRERVTGPKLPICFSYLREARCHNLLDSSLAPYSLHQTSSLIITSLPREQNNYFKVKDFYLGFTKVLGNVDICYTERTRQAKWISLYPMKRKYILVLVREESGRAKSGLCAGLQNISRSSCSVNSVFLQTYSELTETWKYFWRQAWIQCKAAIPMGDY